MKKIYDAVCITGKYIDKEGKEKTRYLNVGVVLEGDKGASLKLEALPINFNGWINFYEPKPKQREPGSDDDFGNDDIPI